MFAGNTMLLPKSSTGTPEAFNKASAHRSGPVGGTVHHLQARPRRTANHVDPQPEVVGRAAAVGHHHLPRPRRRRAHPRAAEQYDRRHRTRVTRRADDRADAPRASRSGAHPGRAGITSPSTAHPGRSSPTRRCGWPSPRASTVRPSPNVTQRGLADNPAPLNNHIFVAGQEGYQDNSAVVAFDPEKAKQELDALGWTHERPVPREGRPSAGHPRRVLRLPPPGSSRRSPRTASPRSA